MNKSIFISAGEASGDMHATHLIKNLKKLNSDFSFFGIGGEMMSRAGVDLIRRMDKLSIIGIWEAIVKLAEIKRLYKSIMKRIDAERPSVAILIDYPGFNLMLAKGLKKKGIKVIYYITPQVWAWGFYRIKIIKNCVDKALVILRFEEDLFKKYGIDAEFVGHPLLDRETNAMKIDKKSLNLEEKKTTIALLPGSRESEVIGKLPLMLKTAKLVLNKIDAQFVLLKSSSVSEEVYTRMLSGSEIPLGFVKNNSYGALEISDFVLTSSGTATLETAIMEKPMIITYKTSFLTALIFKLFAATKFIGLVNIIAGRKISPEILQYDATPKRLSSEILSILSSKEKIEKQVNGLRWVKNALGTPGASLRAARIIENFIKLQR